MNRKTKAGALMSRPDVVYACLVALIIVVGLIARGLGVLPLR